MEKVNVEDAADRMIEKFGVSAKRETLRLMLQAVRDDDADQREFWQAVLEYVISRGITHH